MMLESTPAWLETLLGFPTDLHGSLSMKVHEDLYRIEYRHMISDLSFSVNINILSKYLFYDSMKVLNEGHKMFRSCQMTSKESKLVVNQLMGPLFGFALAYMGFWRQGQLVHKQ